MITNATFREAGARWQHRLQFEDVVGKRLIFIGLGNSTAEMLRQMHDFLDGGVDTDYRVLTHYSVDAVFNPNAYVYADGKLFRVFRDVSRPNLVDFQGDLSISRHDYYR